MPRLTDSDILSIVTDEEQDALNYHNEISEKRARLLDFYNCRPYGDEVDGQSQVITSDVSDTIEGMLPTLLRIFTQGKQIAVFDGDRAELDEEAEQKTQLANWVFMRQNNGVLILHDMFKDALLQFTGTVKVYWDEYDEIKTTRYRGLNEMEVQALQLNPEIEFDEIEQDEYGFYSVVCKSTKRKGKCCVVNIPPEEFVIARRSRSFYDAPFIGHKSPKTRSQLIEMGFDPKVVNDLPVETDWNMSAEKNSRYWDFGSMADLSVSNHSPNDEIMLGEYYLKMDVDGDGVAEMWQVHIAGEQILGKEQVDDHPFAVCVPIPIPHRAIGTCPAEQVADLQFRKSTLERQLFNNIYNANFPRIMANERVEMDDLLTPRAGGVVRINDKSPIGDSAAPLLVPAMASEILEALEYTNTAREVRTGVTRYNQGLDTDSLNKTATGFKGIQDMSQQRIDLIARIFAETGVKDIFKKIISVCGKYQNESMQIKALGKVIDINPASWSEPMDCRIDVGIGSGDRNEKIANLNFILQTQMAMMQSGMVLADQAKIYKTMDKLITESGLKDVSLYFNNPEIPEETLFAQNQQLTMMLQQKDMLIEQIMQEANKEKIRADAQIAIETNRAQIAREKDAMETDADFRKTMLKLAQDWQQFQADMLFKLTELDMKINTPQQDDIPGTLERTA